MKYILFLTFSSIYCNLLSQLDTIYYDSDWEEIENQEDALFFRIGEIQDDMTYLVKDYYISGELQMTGQLNSKKDQKRIGEFIWFYENGQLSSKGSYNLNEDKFGVWEHFHSNGIKETVAIYSSNGEFKRQTKYFKDGIINNRSKGAIAAWYINAETLEGELRFCDKCSGVYFEYNLDGKLTDKIFFKEGSIVKHRRFKIKQ